MMVDAIIDAVKQEQASRNAIKIALFQEKLKLEILLAIIDAVKQEEAILNARKIALPQKKKKLEEEMHVATPTGWVMVDR